MNSRPFPQTGFPTKNQEVSITLRDGRTFAICSKGQFRYLLDMARQRIIADAIDKGELTNEAEADNKTIEERLLHWREHQSQYATMDWVLERMSPQERKDWEAKYRFGGVFRRK